MTNAIAPSESAKHRTSLADRIAAFPRASHAVTADDAELSYGELIDHADELAVALRRLGVGDGSLVAIGLPRSAALVVACLGVLRVGAVYVAVDPSQPAEHARAQIADSGAELLLTGPNGIDHGVEITSGPVRIRLTRVGPTRLPLDVDPTNPPAYVMFTSGSTGHPKGVVVGHSGLMNLVDWHGPAFDVTPHTRCSQLAGPGFDAAAWEVWGCLGNGGTLIVAPEALKNDPAGLRDWLAEERIEVAFIPTPLAELVLALTWSDGAALRFMLTGGDRLNQRPPAGLPFTVVNNYGVTEATVVSTSVSVSPGEGAPTIGSAIDGAVLRVCDADLAEVLVGERGELLTGGAGVALGYLNAPELTATAFVTLPDGSGRWYRTGDVVVHREDGEYEYLGRIDDQVQVRGHRVEPGEVASVLTRRPDVAAAAVISIGESSELRLAAFCQPHPSSTLDGEQLRSWLAEQLPAHMVPTFLLPIDALPFTTNGKVDRIALRALLSTNTNDTDDGDAGDVETDVEKAVAEIVARLLKMAVIGPEDDFLLFGGHSLLGAQVVARLADRFGVEISLRDVFDNPTPRGMAQLVTEELVAQVLALNETQLAEMSAEVGS